MAGSAANGRSAILLPGGPQRRFYQLSPNGIVQARELLARRGARPSRRGSSHPVVLRPGVAGVSGGMVLFVVMAAVLPLVLAEFGDWSPWLAERLVR